MGRLSRNIYSLVCLLSYVACSYSAWGADSAPGADVTKLLQLARQQNPEFAATRLEADAAAERIASAAALPDPVLRTELRDFTNQSGNPSVYYRVMQTLPWPGKRGLQQEVAEAESKQAQGRSALSWAELAARIKINFAQYYVLVRSEKLTQEIFDLVTRLEHIAQARYATGLAPQQDVIRAQMEQTELRRDLVMLNTDQHHAMTRLNTLLQREPYAPLAEPQHLRPLPAADKLTLAALEERLRIHNPQLFTLNAQLATAEKSRALTLKNRYPDITVGLAPTQIRGKITEWELMFELNIPLQQQSRRSREREADTLLAAARSRKEAAANQLLGDLVENVLALDAAQRLVTLNANSLQPQAEASLQAALAGYQNGKVDFATLLDAQRQILKAKLDVLNAQAEAQTRLAEIEKLVGEEL
ncbi:MAG: TolC family protein [Gallionellaceae bacterium]|nr:TolC family protein [Gallionellaceae bacterium]